VAEDVPDFDELHREIASGRKAWRREPLWLHAAACPGRFLFCPRRAVFPARFRRDAFERLPVEEQSTRRRL